MLHYVYDLMKNKLNRKSITGPILKEQAMNLNQKIEENKDFIAFVGLRNR